MSLALRRGTVGRNSLATAAMLLLVFATMLSKWASNPEPLTSLNLDVVPLPGKDKTGRRLEPSALERMSVAENATTRSVLRTRAPRRLEMMELVRGAW